MGNLERVNEYLNETGVFFLATENGEQPKCRPLGLHALINGQLYFGVGNFKEVYQQMCVNPKVEIVASKRQDWLRVYGTAVFEQDDTIANLMLEKVPALKALYNDQAGAGLAAFHLEGATAEFRSMVKVEEQFSF